MREKGTTNSSMLRGLEIIRESFAAGRVLSPSSREAGSGKRSSTSESHEEIVGEETELSEICALGKEEYQEEEMEEDQMMENVATNSSQPISSSSSSSSSSFLPSYGEINRSYARSRALEMGPGLSRVYSAPINWRPENSIAAAPAPGRRETFFSSSPRVNISRKQVLDDQEGLNRFQTRLQNRRSSVSSTESVVEEASEEAWERRRRDSRSSSSSLLFLAEEEEEAEMMMSTSSLASERSRVAASRRSVGRSVSDCGETTCWPALLQRTRSRTRSLTDEDMDELRGCIDLGFGFSNEQEDMELCNTLPALELCYAITRQYNDVVTGRSSSSPISTSGRSSNSISRSFDQTSSSSSSSLDRTSSSSSLLSSPMESWRISSPGRNPLFHHPSTLTLLDSTKLLKSLIFCCWNL
jgi:hypothetical protein